MRKEAKYMLKRDLCLTKDDMDLRVTICHIRGRRSFEPELTFWRSFALLTVTIVKTHIELACPCIALQSF
jgi:hypothetical protein